MDDLVKGGQGRNGAEVRSAAYCCGAAGVLLLVIIILRAIL